MGTRYIYRYIEGFGIRECVYNMCRYSIEYVCVCVSIGRVEHNNNGIPEARLHNGRKGAWLVYTIEGNTLGRCGDKLAFKGVLCFFFLLHPQVIAARVHVHRYYFLN